MILKYARREVVTARPEDLVQDVAGQMDYYHVGCVVVVRNDRPVGLVTDRDLALTLLERRSGNGKDPGTVAVRDIMSKDPRTIREDEGFDRAIELMAGEGVRRLPVVGRQGRLRGIITLDDVFEELCKDMQVLGGLLKRQQKIPRKPAKLEETRAASL